MLFRNTVAQSLPRVLGLSFSVILAPIILSQLGLEQFGLWAVTGALAQYAGLLDLGVSRALPRFVALHHSQGRRDLVRSSVAVGVLTYLVLGVLVVGAAAACGGLMHDAFDVLSTGDTRIVLISSAGIFALVGMTNVLLGVPLGLQNSVPAGVALTVGYVVNFGLSVAALYGDGRLVTYALANVAASAVGLIAAYVAARRTLGERLVARPTRGQSRELVSFGLKTQTVLLATVVNQQMDKIVLASMVSVKLAGAFEIAARVVNAVRQIAVLSLSAMVPAGTAALVNSGEGHVRELYERYSRLSNGTALPLFGVMLAGAPYLLGAWLGDVPAHTLTVVSVLSVAFALSTTTGGAMTVAVAAGRPGLPARSASAVVVVNVVLTLSLAPFFGLTGVLIGTCAAELLGTVAIFVLFHRAFGVPAAALQRGVLQPVALVSAVTAVALALRVLVIGAVDDRLLDLAAFACTSAVLIGLYWPLASRFGYLPARLALRRRASGGAVA